MALTALIIAPETCDREFIAGMAPAFVRTVISAPECASSLAFGLIGKFISPFFYCVGSKDNKQVYELLECMSNEALENAVYAALYCVSGTAQVVTLGLCNLESMTGMEDKDPLEIEIPFKY